MGPAFFRSAATLSVLVSASACSDATNPPYTPPIAEPPPDSQPRTPEPQYYRGSPLYSLLEGEHLAAAITDADAVYLAIRTKPNDASCFTSGRWVRVLKDGSRSEVLGPLDPATTCSIQGYWGTVAVNVDADRVYWLSRDEEGNGRLVAVPKKGGDAHVLASFGARWLGSMTIDEASIYVLDMGTHERRYRDGALLRVPKSGGSTTVVTTTDVTQQFRGEIGNTSQYVAWVMSADCDRGGWGCESVIYQRMPKAGGTPETLLKVRRASQGVISKGFFHYFTKWDDVQTSWSTLNRLSIADGNEEVLQPSAYATGLRDLQAIGAEVVVSDWTEAPRMGDPGRYLVQHFPDGFGEDGYLPNLSIDIEPQSPCTSDEGAAYVEKEGAVHRLAFRRRP